MEKLRAMLQVNTAGSWKNVVAFDNARMPEVRKAVRILSDALPNAKWCFLLPNGKREWLKPLADLEKDSMRTLSRAVSIADNAARSDIECYALGVEMRNNGAFVYDLTKPSDSDHDQTEESMALQVQIAQRAAEHIRSRPVGAFPWRLRSKRGKPHLVWFEDKKPKGKARGAL